MSRGKKDLDALVDAAQEAEADPDRHRMEEAVLATFAKDLPAGPFVDTFAQVWTDLSFSRADLAAIAVALVKLADEGIAADLVLVRDRLPKSAKVSDAVLDGILDGSKAKDATVAAKYVKKLAALNVKRRAQEALREAQAKVEDGDVDAGVGGLLKDIIDLAETKRLVKTHPPENIAAAGFLNQLDARRKDERPWQGLDAGFHHLNEVLNGLTEGVFVLSGAPSTGKTTLAKQIADQVAKNEEVPVLFFSFEQSAEELRIKSLARLSMVNSRYIWKGRADDATWSEVKKADEKYRRDSGPYLTIIEADRTDTVEKIRTVAMLAKHRAGGKRPVLVIIDYLQIIPPPPGVRLDGIKDRVDWNLSELRRLSRDLKSPVLVVSSENREAYKKVGKDSPPALAALKESGGIEYSADAVIMLRRNKTDTDNMKGKHTFDAIRVEANVTKNRNGELAKILMDFTPALATFADVDKEALDWFDVTGGTK